MDVTPHQVAEEVVVAWSSDPDPDLDALIDAVAKAITEAVEQERQQLVRVAAACAL